MEVQRASLMRPIRHTLLGLCKEGGVLAPMYTWEQWQSRCKAVQAALPGSRVGGWGLGGRRRRQTRSFPAPAAWMMVALPTWCMGGAIQLWPRQLWRMWDRQWQTPQRCSRVMVREGEAQQREGGRGGGTKGRIIVLVVVDVDIKVKLLTLMSTVMATAVELKVVESRTAVGGA
jgi:hypothetical protein